MVSTGTIALKVSILAVGMGRLTDGWDSVQNNSLSTALRALVTDSEEKGSPPLLAGLFSDTSSA